MTKDEYLRRVREIYTGWVVRNAERIPSEQAALSQPHNGADSDFPVHHAIMSGDVWQTKSVLDQIAELTAQYQSPGNPQRGR